MKEKRKGRKPKMRVKPAATMPRDISALMERLSRTLPTPRDLGKSCAFMERAHDFSWRRDAEVRVEVGCCWKDGTIERWLICVSDARRCQHIELSTQSLFALTERAARVMRNIA